MWAMHEVFEMTDGQIGILLVVGVPVVLAAISAIMEFFFRLAISGLKKILRRAKSRS